MKRLISVLTLVLALVPMAQAREVAGVEIPETMNTEGTELALNGAGVRTKWFMDIYAGGLYLQQPSQDAQAIMKADEPMAIKLQMVSGLITSDKMKDAVTEGFQGATSGDTSAIQSEIDRFIAVFDEEIKEGDIFDLVYVPGKGVNIYKNGQFKETINGGMPFKQALFGIWLSDKPAQEQLKKSMLGAS